MFPNDDLKKDVQSWRYVQLSDEAAWMNNFKTKEDIVDYVNNICGEEINFNEVLIPIHYDATGYRSEFDLEKFFFDQDDDVDFKAQILHLHNDHEDENYLDPPQIMNILEFITYEYSISALEAFEILIDQET